MKRFNFKGAGMMALALSTLAAVASAQQSPRIRLNGQPFRTQTAAVTQNGRVLVPMRAIFEALGANVNFNRSDRSIVANRGETVVRMTLGRRRALVNNQPVRLDVTPIPYGGRTLVPLRFVSEALGASVNYDSNRNLVIINERAKSFDRDGDGIRNRQDEYPDNARR